MEKKTAAIRTPKEIFAQTKEQSIEADLLLPDYYPEISKILDCAVRLSEEAVTVTADKISVSGAARVRLLYASVENELKVYEAVTKYTRLNSGNNFETSDICVVRQTVSSLNFRAVSPRKVEVRAVAAVRAEMLRMEETTLLTDVSGGQIQKRTVTAGGFRISAFAEVRFELNEKLSLPVSKEKIGGILRDNVKIAWNELRCVNNKLMLGGIAEISFVYITQENAVSPECSVNLPFTQICELYGTLENDECCIAVKNASLSIDLKDSGCGENEAAVIVSVEATAVTGKQEELTFIDDAYAVKSELILQNEPVFLPGRMLQKAETAAFSGEAQSYDIRIAQICDKSVSDIAYTVSYGENAIGINGSCKLSILTKTEDSAFYCFSRNCSFEHTIENTDGASLVALQIEPRGIALETASEGAIRYQGELDVKYLLLQGMRREVLTEIEEAQPADAPNEEKIVLYYGEKGESLWDIAKENRTSLPQLKALNELNEDVLSDQKLLVFRA